MGKGRNVDPFIALQGQGLGIRIGDFREGILFPEEHPQGIDLEPQPVFPCFTVFLDEAAALQRIHSAADSTLMKVHQLADTGHTEGPFFL